MAGASTDTPGTPGDDAEPAVAGAPVRSDASAGPVPGAATRKGPARFAAFLRASWAELQRVQWPDRAQVGQATTVVIGFVIIAGAYLGLADAAAQRVIDLILPS